MVAVIDTHRRQLEALCRRYRVRRLDVFGSAADGTFDPCRSDLDFLVEYQELSAAEHYESYFGLLEAMEDLFRRKIDLVEATAMRNRHFIAEVNASRKLVYEAD